MKLKKRYWAISPMVVLVLGLWSVLTPSTAIVAGRVFNIAPYQGGYLAQIDARQAFPTTFFEVFSDCNLAWDSTVFIAVPISGMLFGHQPTSQDADLYRAQGIGFVPWNGC